MIISDLHTHSTFSTDGKSTLEDMISSAVDKNINIYCITEHMDYNNHNYQVQEFLDEFDILDSQKARLMFQCDTDAYYNSFKSLKKIYADKIDLRFGIELGLQADLGNYYQKYISSFPFDFILGSLHEAGGIDPYYKSFLSGKTPMEAYSFYFQQALLSIKNCLGCFDVFAHPDYVLRYHTEPGKEFLYTDYQDELDAILHCIIENGIGLELNTGSFRYFSPETLPIVQILKRYKDLGGEIVTVGSDAHQEKEIARSFALANEILIQCNFQYYTVYKTRKPEFIKL